MIDIKQREEDDRVVITATLRYRLGDVRINGAPTLAVDFLDGSGFLVIDPHRVLSQRT